MKVLDVSVVVVTCRRPADLEDALASVVTQRRMPSEVLVVAQPDDASTPPVVEAFAAKTGLVRLVVNGRGDALTVARNVGLAAAKGDVVLFLDDDVVLDPSYVGTLVAHMEAHPGILGAQGHWAADAPWGAKARLKSALASAFGLSHARRQDCRVLRTGHVTYPVRPRGATACEWLSGCNMAYRREVFAEERFDERLRFGSYGEDWDLSHRVAARHPGALVLLPEARLVHRSSPQTRAPVPRLVTMREVYADYLHHKHFGRSRLAVLARKASKAGEFIQYVAFALFARGSPRGYQRAYLRAWLAARRTCRRNRRAIRAGDLTFLDGPLETSA